MSTTSSADIATAAAILRAGGLVAFPTETVYGLGANALDVRAVARIFDVKGRPRFDPLIVHVPDRAHAEALVTGFPPPAQQLADRFWPGPLTLVLPKTEVVPDLVTAGGSTVAIRVPDHPLALALLRASGVPIAAPSANLFGRVSPTTAAHVREQLGDQIDLILDGGPCRVGVESTVLQLTSDGPPRLLRPGGITLEELEAVLGPIDATCRVGCAHQPVDTASLDSAGSPIGGHSPPCDSAPFASPGMLPQHYAPRTPLVLMDAAEIRRVGCAHQQDGMNAAKALVAAGGGHSPPYRANRLGLLAFMPLEGMETFDRIEILSPTGDLREAAANFFAALRRLDAAGLDAIFAQAFPNHGLGRALNDRLERAATPSP